MQALVRHAAVHGAVTVLRQPVQALMVTHASAEPGTNTPASTSMNGPHEAPRCCGIVTNAGQQVRCGQQPRLPRTCLVGSIETSHGMHVCARAWLHSVEA